jgi:hypothetical protein
MKKYFHKISVKKHESLLGATGNSISFPAKTAAILIIALTLTMITDAFQSRLVKTRNE